MKLTTHLRVLSWLRMSIAARLLTVSAAILLGAFVQLQKATISCDMSLSLSVCLSVCPPAIRPSFLSSVRMEKHSSHWTDFHEIIYLSIFRKSVEKIQVSLKFDKNNGYFTWGPTHIHVYTECPRRNGQNFGRVFLMLHYTDITQNTYIQSWTVTEIMAREKCGLLGCPRTVRRPWRILNHCACPATRNH